MSFQQACAIDPQGRHSSALLLYRDYNLAHM
ncbi:hypothetical protein ABID37_002723 [Aquamicrobium terrae]|uniref:Uncharacterized protein n=1 Tax=Aquamicrobium terrae TaxID=1324945 RepID=A0ABV2N0B8_9HYPH